MPNRPGSDCLNSLSHPTSVTCPSSGSRIDRAEPHGVDRHGLTRLGVDRRPVDLVSLDHRQLQVSLAGGDVERLGGEVVVRLEAETLEVLADAVDE